MSAQVGKLCLTDLTALGQNISLLFLVSLCFFCFCFLFWFRVVFFIQMIYIDLNRFSCGFFKAQITHPP